MSKNTVFWFVLVFATVGVVCFYAGKHQGRSEERQEVFTGFREAMQYQGVNFDSPAFKQGLEDGKRDRERAK